MSEIFGVTIPIAVPNGYDEIVRHYGDPHLWIGVDGKARWDPRWEAQSMTLIYDLAPTVPKLYVHRLIVEPLKRAMGKALAKGWIPKSVGCFNPRLKRGRSGRISCHTWGIAVDLDADANPIILDCPKGDPRRSAWWSRKDRLPDGVIEAFKSEQWIHGASFEDPFDPQHFQLCAGY